MYSFVAFLFVMAISPLVIGKVYHCFAGRTRAFAKFVEMAAGGELTGTGGRIPPCASLSRNDRRGGGSEPPPYDAAPQTASPGGKLSAKLTDEERRAE